MHTDSGLLPLIPSGVTSSYAEEKILEYLSAHTTVGKSPLAGNSIGMDRNFISRDMPKLDAHLHYRSIDVSSIKELARRWYPKIYFDAPKKEYLHRRNTLVSRLNAMPGVYCPNPGGAFYAMARLPIDDGDRFCQWLLESFSHDGQTVMLAPASGFYGTPGLGKNEVRLAYVLNADAINAAMDCLEKALEQYPGRK